MEWIKAFFGAIALGAAIYVGFIVLAWLVVLIIAVLLS